MCFNYQHSMRGGVAMKRYAWLLIAALMFSPISAAREVAGVVLPETLQIPDNAIALHLNGAGIRKKVFFKIYIDKWSWRFCNFMDYP